MITGFREWVSDARKPFWCETYGCPHPCNHLERRLPQPAGNLPAEPNGFVGRERDLVELARLLDRVRVLTLCGPGGIGKTRLAIRLAADLAPRYPDGVWLVDLAVVDAPRQVVAALADTLGIRADREPTLAGTVARALRSRSMLLLLDTCEHVIEAVAELAGDLMAACPELRVVATSREPLRVRGETVWRVPPLDPPPGGDDGAAGPGPAADLYRYDSVRLFASRAAAARPGFAVSPESAAAVARICRRLDGVPLALELAAACVRALSVEQLAERLEDRFALLALGDRTAPQRQQTLLATVEWSYGLLTGPEQVLLRRLSVFRGWSVEMAERVCADDLLPVGEILGLLTALIDKSLVIGDGELNGQARYRLLDAVRQYAAERAAEAGEGTALPDAHAAYLLELVEGIAGQAFRSGEPAWPQRLLGYRRLLAERANYRAALGYLAERADASRGLRICSALAATWVLRGHSAAGAELLDRFLAFDVEVSPGVRVQALANRAELAFDRQDYQVASEFGRASLALSRSGQAAAEPRALRLMAMLALRDGQDEQALELAAAGGVTARREGNDWERGVCVTVGAAALARLGRLADAEEAYAEALELMRDNHIWGTAKIRSELGGLAARRGDHEAAAAQFSAALACFSELGADPELARCQAGIGLSALALGDLETARSNLLASLGNQIQAGAQLGTARCLTALAQIALAGGATLDAVRLLSAAAAVQVAVGGAALARIRQRAERLLAQARGQLGPAAVGELLGEGGPLSPSEAARLAAGLALRPGAAEPAPRPGAAEPAPQPAAAGWPAQPAQVAPLTERELEVARLVASGLSNHEIGERLFITQATVARHVANIFTKLGLRRRSQVAAWMARTGPAGQSYLHMPLHSSADAV